MLIESDRIGLSDNSLISFLKENDFTGLKLRLLLFWGKHPQAKFNIDCIAHVLDITQHHLRDILRDLIKRGIINEHFCQSGIAHYSLNTEHMISEYITELSQLDWGVIKNLEGELEKELLPA